MLWRDGSVPFPFGKDGSGVLANCSLCGVEATLSFSAGPVCSSISAEACAILHALCWSRQHQQVCHFSSLLLLSDSRSVLATLSSPLSFLLPQSLSETVFSLLQFYQATMGAGHSFLPDGDAADELARRGALIVPSAIPCCHSSHLWYALFSDCRHTVSSKFFDTQVPSVSTEELVLPRHARCVLSRLRCNGHSLLLSSYLSRIGRIEILPGVPADTRPSTPLILFCTVQLRTLCVARSLAIFCFSTISIPGPVELPGFWGSMIFRHQAIPQKGSGNNRNSKTEIVDAPLRYKELGNSDASKQNYITICNLLS